MELDKKLSSFQIVGSDSDPNNSPILLLKFVEAVFHEESNICNHLEVKGNVEVENLGEVLFRYYYYGIRWSPY